MAALLRKRGRGGGGDGPGITLLAWLMSWCHGGQQWSPKQDVAPMANRAVLGCLLEQTHAGSQHPRVATATAGAPGHAFRLSLVYIWASGKECEISPEAHKQQLSFATTTDI